MKTPLLLAALITSVVTACHREGPAPATDDQSLAPPTTTPAEPAPQPSDAVAGRIAFRPQFADDAIGIALLPVQGFALHRDFKRSYFDNGEWKAYAGPDSKGKPLAALVLDGSNDVTAAELRIGASDDAQAVKTCLQPANTAESAQTEEVRIDGQAFQHFRAADAAMSHYLDVDAYRSVRNGHCIAIDLLVVGTRPEVYDPPRTPPFDQATARAKLQEALAAVRITR